MGSVQHITRKAKKTSSMVAACCLVKWHNKMPCIICLRTGQFGWRSSHLSHAAFSFIFSHLSCPLILISISTFWHLSNTAPPSLSSLIIKLLACIIHAAAGMRMQQSHIICMPATSAWLVVMTWPGGWPHRLTSWLTGWPGLEGRHRACLGGSASTPPDPSSSLSSYLRLPPPSSLRQKRKNSEMEW